jgi:hypothetical protein
MHAQQARKRGAPLFGYFLSGKREKVTRPPKEGESFASKENPSASFNSLREKVKGKLEKWPSPIIAEAMK